MYCNAYDSNQEAKNSIFLNIINIELLVKNLKFINFIIRYGKKSILNYLKVT